MNDFNIIEYVVKRGDSLYSISKQFNLNPDDLMKYNNLSSTLIYPNQILFIPLNKEEGIKSEHITKVNDTLESIAIKYNLSHDEILRLNDVFKLSLAPNQVVSLSNMRSNKHLVLPTDTIESILKRYNLTIEDLIRLNGSNWLVVGESIKVK